ncbi:MAG: Cell division protein FtsA, partial [uncultured Campylobacterales bacterium]
MNLQDHTILGIDIGSHKISAIITTKDSNNHIEVIGVGKAPSKGIQKGLITNIDLASNSIKQALTLANQIAGTEIDSTVVSISGSYIQTTDSYGVVNIPNKEISLDEINRVMQMANHNANELPDYEKLHVIPYEFQVDKQNNVDDPIGMSGSRLEVKAHVISANSISLGNLKKALKKAGVKPDNFVYTGYASSIAVLEDDEKELGVATIDLGSHGCELNIFLNNNLVHSEFLEIGSNSITSDLAMALHTSLDVAEDLKIKYATLKPCSDTQITIPKIADEEVNRTVSLERVLQVIYARLEETFIIIAKMVEKTNLQ